MPWLKHLLDCVAVVCCTAPTLRVWLAWLASLHVDVITYVLWLL